MKLMGLLLATAYFFLLPPVQAQTPTPIQSENDDEWRYSLQVGGIMTPVYLGDDSYQLSVFPNASVQYGERFSASLQGVTYSAFSYGGLSAGPVVRLNFGRDEQGSNPLGIGGENNDLLGLGDIDFAFELGAFVQYRYQQWLLGAEVRQAQGGHDGTVAQLEFKYQNSINIRGMPLFYTLGPELSWGDDDFTQAFFAVTEAQSAASGLAVFAASGGVNAVGFQGTVVAPLGESLSVILLLGYQQLMGDAADASLVQERGSEHQGTAGVMLSYRF